MSPITQDTWILPWYQFQNLSTHLHHQSWKHINRQCNSFKSNVFSGINANECGGNIFNTSGVLTSPNYPGLYPHSLDCQWNITVPNGTIGFIISQFSVEYHRYCAYDRLSVSKALFVTNSNIYIAAKNCNRKI